jgi:SAM-dependent methyltransferase
MATQYDAKQSWSKAAVSSQQDLTFPAEYIIRIFKGKYPHLKLKDEVAFEGKKICDVSCGNGANLSLVHQCGFKIFGTEISADIVDIAKQHLARRDIRDFDIRVGTNENIPFDNAFFDFLISWNSCYYMGQQKDFGVYVKEFARVIREDGYFVLSIPKKTCYIFDGAEPSQKGYCVIKKDPFGVRNGEIMRVFQDEEEIRQAFSPYFGDFIFGSIQDDCFGFAYHWHLAVCRRKKT